jgi:hypothetical protein
LFCGVVGLDAVAFERAGHVPQFPLILSSFLAIIVREGNVVASAFVIRVLLAIPPPMGYDAHLESASRGA